MKPTILLINPPGKEIYLRDIFHSFSSKGRYLWQPTDLVFLSGRLKNDFELEIIDAIAERASAEAIYSRLQGKSYHAMIGLSGSVSFRSDMAFFEKLVEITGSRLILMGDLVRYQFRQVLARYPFVHAVLDDFSSEDILTYLKDEKALDQPRAMAVRKNGSFTEMILPATTRVINIPVPRHDLFPLQAYGHPNNRSRPMATILGSVGCPFQCGYCSQSTRNYKFREAENILEEIEYLQSLGCREILFRDQLMEAVPKNFLALLEGIVKKKWRLGWTCNARVDTLKREWLPLMKAAGCHTIIFGVENPSQKILDDWNTKKCNDQTKALFDEVRKNGIDPCGYFILGLPGETKEDVLRTIDYAVHLNPALASFSLPSPDFGTKLREIAIQKGILSDDLENTDRSADATLLNDLIGPGELQKLRSLAYRRFYFRPSYFISSLRSIQSWIQFRFYISEFFHMAKGLFLAQ